MKAKKKPLVEVELDDLDLDEDDVEAKQRQLKFIYLRKRRGARITRRYKRSSNRAGQFTA